LLLALSVTAPRVARAETDAFGVGSGRSGAKTVTGNEVINAYARVAEDVPSGATQIAFGAVVGQVDGFAAGDLVLIWRATGVPASEAPSGAAGRVDLKTAVNPATGPVGRFEFGRIAQVVGSTMSLTKPVVSAWAKDVTQVVKVPEYTTVTVPAGQSLVAAPWAASGSGFAGGILAFVANGTVNLQGNLDANGRGFRGGEKVQRVANPPLGCPDNDGTPADGYADKGEGVCHTEFGLGKGGRGNRTIGAGGGNCIETGGGGGGNFGNGGRGGDSFTTTDRAGMGGVGIDYSLLERISLGGGGGAGEQKNGVGSSGATGGGAIFVRAKALAGPGKITANGGTAENAGIFNLESDGAGGGGAGGSILVRIVGDADCGGLAAVGGNGGDTAVVGVGFWGPGGGGGGGRTLIQAGTVSATCTTNVGAGAPGKSGITPRGATTGASGVSEPSPGGRYCFSNPPVAADAQCSDPQPVCETTSGVCKKCAGPFGDSNPLACPVANEPVCSSAGACLACNGDLGSGTTASCQRAGSPYCFQSGGTQGTCGKCTTETDCQGPGHPGPKCNPQVGACGTPCKQDTDCKGSQWCAQDVCIPKTTNGEHVPGVPPIDGECTVQKGQRVCISAVCEPDDDLCGLKNGSPCEGINEKCRTSICFPSDKLCGKPSGETCTGNAECRSAECKDGICKGCNTDADCPLKSVCDRASKTCVPGCRPGECPPGTGDGNVGIIGIVEGGGCACETTGAAGTSTLAVLGVAMLGTLAAVRRRRKDYSQQK